MRALFLLRRCLAVACLSLSPDIALADPFSFVVLGDQPYGSSKAVTHRYRSLIRTINDQNPSLVIHVGDTKTGSSPCTDAMLRAQLNYLNSFEAPTLYSPGDNEWTDCYRLVTGAYDEVERLDHIRNTYFADPGSSFGQVKIKVAHQSDRGYPENTRVILNDVMFVVAHVVGSNNNFEATRPDSAHEFATRDKANRDWLQESFAAAKGARALVLAIHGDMFEFGFGTPRDPEGFLRHSGFGPFGYALIREAGKFGKPVLLVYGDSHRFTVFRPFPQKAPNIVAVETFGGKHMHALKIHVTLQDAFPFAIQPLINPDQPLGETK